MAKSPEEIAAGMIASLKEKTGRSIEEWLKITRASELQKHGELVKFLKTDHGVTHGYANLIAHETLQSAAAHADGGDLVAEQYGGAKAGLRPIYDAILAAVGAFGGDLDVAPKKTYVSLRRKKQFAIVQPSTKDRVDVGINLKGTAPSGRLEASGSFNAMVSHRVRLSAAAEVDKELVGWLRKAYEAAG